MKYLILLNRKFPYRSGEAFLENEIDEISHAFDKILIYPSDIQIGENQTRKIISNNVEIHIVEKKSLKIRKLNNYIASCKYIRKKTKLKSLKTKLFENYFLTASEHQTKKIINNLKNIKFSKDDTIYIYSYWLYINAKVACNLKKYFENIGVKTITFSRAHRFDIYEENHPLKYLPQREELLKDLDHIYACSNNGTKYLQKKYKKYAQKISTSQLGTYNHGIGKASNRPNFRIVSCSRLSDVKRVNLIIESLKYLEEYNIPISWTHLGGGELYNTIKKEVEKSLTWMEVNLVGSVPNTEVYDYYLNHSCDLFINVSASEGLPVSIMEAISFGIPVIATDVGGTSEIVINNKSGYLLEKDFDPKELSNLIKKIVTMNKEDYNALRKSTRKIWEESYQAPKNYGSFLNKILKLK